MIGKGWLITCTEGRRNAAYSWYGKERPRGWVKSVSEACHFQSPRFCTLSTANIRCILCHINNMALDAPTISCQKCANPRALLIQLENVKRESIPDEVGGGLRQLRGAVHVDPVPGTVALQNEKENRWNEDRFRSFWSFRLVLVQFPNIVNHVS